MSPLHPAAATSPAALPLPADDLEALFDRVSAESQAAPAPAGPSYSSADEDLERAPVDVFHRIGMLTRNLHDALRELGYDKDMENAVGSLPDARARLSYIARLTGEAAHKALCAVEQGQGVQSAVDADARALSARWDRVFAGEADAEAFRALAGATRDFLAGVPQRAAQTSQLLTDIMMAQDFHDLTGQVIQKVMAVAENLEAQLVKLLLETTPQEVRGAEGFLNGPVIDTARQDSVSSQAQVDDLLESLGF